MTLPVCPHHSVDATLKYPQPGQRFAPFYYCGRCLNERLRGTITPEEYVERWRAMIDAGRIAEIDAEIRRVQDAVLPVG